MLEVSKVVAAEAGADRTGIRISPVTPANDVSDSNPQPLFDYIVDGLNTLKLVYLHVIEGATGGPRDIAPFDYASLRKRFKQTYIANNGYDFALATKVLDAGAADLIAFGKPFISNPDLVERLKKAPPRSSGKGDVLRRRRYTDYPTLAAAERRVRRARLIKTVIARGRATKRSISARGRWCFAGPSWGAHFARPVGSQ
jgi:N-ethylmaleimide reductase